MDSTKIQVFKHDNIIKFNSIPTQNLFNPNQLNVGDWNNIVNQIAIQGNSLSEYLVKLNKLLFGSTDLYYVPTTNEGILEYLNRYKVDSYMLETLATKAYVANAILEITNQTFADYIKRTEVEERLSVIETTYVPKRLSLLNSIDTSSNRNDMYVYVDDNGTDKKVSIKQLTSFGIRTVSSVPTDLQTNEYIFLEIPKGE